MAKTSKVKTVHRCKEWGQGERKTFYHDIEMENGDKLNIGFKTQKQVGEELTYKFTDEVGQHEFTKAKTVNPEWENKQQGKGDYVKGQKIGHAVTNAVYLIQYDGVKADLGLKGTIKEYAKMIYELSDELFNEL